MIVQIAFGLQLLMAAPNPSPAVVGQAAGQVTARSATNRAEVRVAATAKALSKQRAAYKKHQSKYKQQTKAIEKLSKQRASWNRDRKIRKAKAAAQATGKKRNAAAKEIRRLKKLLLSQRRALIKATDAELAAGPDDVRRAALITLRSRTASKLPSKPKARKIIIPEVDEFADPEELEEQVALLASAEKQLLRQQRLLEQREKRFDKMAQLRDQRQRANQLDQFETNDVRRTTGRLPDNKSGDRGNNESAGATSADSDGAQDPAPPAEPGGGTGGDDFNDQPDGFQESSVVLADVVDTSTVNELRRAGRSSNPKTKASAARKARKQVEARLAKLRALRKKMRDRANKLRK